MHVRSPFTRAEVGVAVRAGRPALHTPLPAQIAQRSIPPFMLPPAGISRGDGSADTGGRLDGGVTITLPSGPVVRLAVPPAQLPLGQPAPPPAGPLPPAPGE